MGPRYKRSQIDNEEIAELPFSTCSQAMQLRLGPFSGTKTRYRSPDPRI